MTDYTTKAVVKAQSNIEDTVDDTTIDAIITAVSGWIDEYCGREFNVASESGSIRTYTAEDTETVYIDDAIEIIEITTDDGSRTYATTMDTDEYEGSPYNAVAKGKVYTKVYTVGGGAFPTARGALRIEARYGWTATPKAIVQACILQTQRLLRRKDAPFGVMGSTSAELGQMQVIPSLDPDIKQLLALYRKSQMV